MASVLLSVIVLTLADRIYLSFCGFIRTNMTRVKKYHNASNTSHFSLKAFATISNLLIASRTYLLTQPSVQDKNSLRQSIPVSIDASGKHMPRFATINAVSLYPTSITHRCQHRYLVIEEDTTATYDFPIYLLLLQWTHWRPTKVALI